MRAARDAAIAIAILLAIPPLKETAAVFSDSHGAERKPDPPARVSLIATDVADQSARLIWIGLHFKVAAGWHVYWRNPGESGSAPKVEWFLPAGASISDFDWPTPRRLLADGLVNYGYENEVTLPARLVLRGDSASGANRIVRARVSYAACREVCVALHDEVTLALDRPIINAAWASQIAAARREVPGRVPASWKVSARCDGRELVVSIAADLPLPGASALPLVPGTIEDSSDQRFTRGSRTAELRLRKSAFMLTPPLMLDLVLVVPGREAFDVHAPLSCT